MSDLLVTGRVVVSRDPLAHDRTDERVYVVRKSASTWTAVTSVDRATQFSRTEAQAIIGSGRWHGLAPLIGPAP